MAKNNDDLGDESEQLPTCHECGTYLHVTTEGEKVCRNEICPAYHSVTYSSGDQVDVQFVPLPPERRAGYQEALRWLTRMILEEVHKTTSSPLGNRGVNSGTDEFTG